ncbi:MAG: hypothetical protein EOO74_06940, partial [Myxococcales bacterium]
MIETAYEAFLQDPSGRFTITGSSFVWCASPALCGTVLWGEQSEAETSSILRLFDQYERHMDGAFDIILDTRGVDQVDPRCLRLLVSWVTANRQGLLKRIRLQSSVIREGPIGFLLTGILPVVGRTHPYRIFTDPLEAFASIDEGATELCAEVDAIAERIRGLPRELRLLRDFLE